MDHCSISLVETIPVGLNYNNNTAQHETIYDSWMDLIGMAQNTIEIASFYWTMRREDVYPDDSAKMVNMCDVIQYSTVDIVRLTNCLVTGGTGVPVAVRSWKR